MLYASDDVLEEVNGACFLGRQVCTNSHVEEVIHLLFRAELRAELYSCDGLVSLCHKSTMFKFN